MGVVVPVVGETWRRVYDVERKVLWAGVPG